MRKNVPRNCSSKFSNGQKAVRCISKPWILVTSRSAFISIQLQKTLPPKNTGGLSIQVFLHSTWRIVNK